MPLVIYWNMDCDSVDPLDKKCQVQYHAHDLMLDWIQVRGVEENPISFDSVLIHNLNPPYSILIPNISTFSSKFAVTGFMGAALAFSLMCSKVL